MINTATVIAFNEKGQILAVSRKHDFDDMNLPGGKSEPGDTDIIETLRREVREETGIELEDIQPLFNGQVFDGYHEHTFTAKAVGEINYDKEKEPAHVAWVHTDVVMDGSFGEYNEMVLGMLGITRQKERETSIAKLRNLLTPFVNYFHLRKMIDSDEIAKEKVPLIQDVVDVEYKNIQSLHMENLLKLVKNDRLWK